MSNLLLDINIIVDICTKRVSYWETSLKAINKCLKNHFSVWIYVGSVQTLEYVVALELRKNKGDEISLKYARYQSGMLLDKFCKNFNWLSSIAEDGEVWHDKDPEDAQLYQAVQRLDNALLLTRDKGMLDRGDFSISPEQYLSYAKNKEQSIQFVDLKTQQNIVRPQLEKKIFKVLSAGQYILGPEVSDLEEKLADFVGVKHCIGISSGSDALLIAMMALGIKAGDEVITTPFSFFATAEMIALLGAKPIFVDIDPRTYNIDAEKIAQAITAKTKAIMPVSLYGQCADFDKINRIAKKYKLPVIEDAAQSLGATYKAKQSCSLTTIACTSFFPSKPLGAYGDGGACFTDNDDLAQMMREIRAHGQDRRYHHPRIGINGRLDTLQAAILLAKFEIFPVEVQQRNEVGENYTHLLQQSCPQIIPPYIEKHNSSVYAQYTIQVEDRQAIIEQLKQANIPVAVHYPIPLHQQDPFKTQAQDLAIAQKMANTVMSLPMHPYLTIEQQEFIVNQLNLEKSVGL